jgi:hypothetical protein
MRQFSLKAVCDYFFMSTLLEHRGATLPKNMRTRVRIVWGAKDAG